MFPRTTSRARTGMRVPRICGGVSWLSDEKPTNLQSSPYLRGCFPIERDALRSTPEFPVSAGVFLMSDARLSRKRRVPRICGGVSRVRRTITATRRSSPYLRGCFLARGSSSTARREFPVSAGVFRDRDSRRRPCERVPRICGGVSDVGLRLIELRQSSPYLRGCFSRLRDARCR